MKIQTATPLADALRAARAAVKAAEIAWYNEGGEDIDPTITERGAEMVNADADFETAKARLSESKELRPWTVIHCDGSSSVAIIAASVEDATRQAHAIVASLSGETEDTTWVDIRLHCLLTGAVHPLTFTLDPEPPECLPGHTHEWMAPLGIVGGSQNSPGVHRGTYGGYLIHNVCRYCARHRIRDTNATRPDTGESGLRSVRYEYEDDRTLAWAEAGMRCQRHARSTTK